MFPKNHVILVTQKTHVVLFGHTKKAKVESLTLRCEFYVAEFEMSAMSDDKILTLGIAGGSGSGKTSIARRIYEKLGGEANVSYLNHDNYYRDVSHKPDKERKATNFDHPNSLETDLLAEHVKALKDGRSIEVPVYDFLTGARSKKGTAMVPKKVLLIEGILLFTHPELVKEIDVKIYVDADEEIRLSRRIVRDQNERGLSREEIMNQFRDTVRPMHEEWVEPSKNKADFVIDNSDTDRCGIETIASRIMTTEILPNRCLLLCK